MTRPRITFGVIVLNGEPFTRYNLRALYPFAHEIIVVEGAAPAAAAVATKDGHSRDDTLEVLRRFKRDEDSEHKVTIVTAEDEGYRDGFWPGEKDEQSRAYARRATGDFLWQVDIDEFYLPEHMEEILTLLEKDPAASGASFHQITFWGNLRTEVDGWFLRRGMSIYHRLFRWGPGYRYVTHRPPTVHDTAGRDLRTGGWLDAVALRRRGIVLHHYSLLFPKQVEEKCIYYGAAPLFARADAPDWYHDVFMALRRPYRVHNVYDYPSWLGSYRGKHPPQVLVMMADIAAGGVAVEMRPMQDVERLLDSPAYRAGRRFLIMVEPLDRWWRASSLARFGRRAFALAKGAVGRLRYWIARGRKSRIPLR